MSITKLYDERINKAMVNILSDKGFDRQWINGINVMSELENLLNELVEKYSGTPEERQKVFHLVHVWGGITGRNIYVKTDGGFRWEQVDEYYKPFVNVCLSIKGNSYADLEIAYKAAVAFNKNVKNIGYSFITKHLHFWGYKNLGKWTFPPHDSVMAENYMKKKYYRHADIIPYWKRIYEEAECNGLDVSEYERKLFNQYHKIRPIGQIAG